MGHGRLVAMTPEPIRKSRTIGSAATVRPAKTSAPHRIRDLCGGVTSHSSMSIYTCQSVERAAAIIRPVDGRMSPFTFEAPRHERVEIAG